MPEVQTVDPTVTRAKFDREVGRFREMEASYRRRGILLQEVSFPTVTVAFCAAKLKPVPLLGAVRIDFTDYDLQPPSVRFVDPLTHEELTGSNCSLALLRLPKKEGMTRETLLAMVAQGMPIELTSLVLVNEPEGRPFICLPGVREYHDNPAHSGDSWLLHRASGEGCLAFIVDNIWKYGPNAMERFVVTAVTQGPGVRMQAQIEVQQIMAVASVAALPE